jgi:hypothetical protein
MMSRNILFDEKTLKMENEGLIPQRLLKLVYNHDIRLAQMPEKCSFKMLRDIVTKMFPSLKSVLIKYKDYDGDMVTITDTQVLRMAESCFDQPVQMEAEKEEKRLSLMRLHIVEVNPEQEPTITEEETEVPVSTTNLKEVPKELTAGADVNMQDSKTEADVDGAAPGSEIGAPESDEKHVQMETETKVESKEKEKEKQLKKMLEGKVLTGKQKEQQKKLEAMRRQFLVQSAEGLGSTSSGTTEVKKRLKYETKKQEPKVVEKEVIEVVMGG